jgi:glycine cleavage system H protein
MSHSFPQDLRYTNDHEWLRFDSGTGRATVGITSFAVEQLGDITIVEVPRKPGDATTQGASFGTIESVKSVSELYAPVSGKIVTINPILKDKPEAVNEAPYGDGWIVELELDAEGRGQIEQLMNADAYAAHVAEG